VDPRLARRLARRAARLFLRELLRRDPEWRVPAPIVPHCFEPPSQRATSRESTAGFHALTKSACVVSMLPGIVFIVGLIESVSPAPDEIG
jgi:hypothetical protein